MKKQQEETIQQAVSMQQMYQAGYLDCWRKTHRGRIAWKDFNLACMKAFEGRFIKKINKIRKKMKKNGKT